MTASPTPQQIELATRLRQVRLDLNFTQARLARLLSREKPIQASTISTWENTRSPVRPTIDRIDVYACIVATATRPGGPVLIPRGQLSEPEHAAYRDALALLTELYDAAEHPSGLTESQPPGLWDFTDDGPLAIICPTAPLAERGPLADPSNPNYTEMHSFADTDALLDLYGHLRMQIGERFPVTYCTADQCRTEDLSGHLVLLGGIGWNSLSGFLQEFLTRLPVRQVFDALVKTGDIFEVTVGGETRRVVPDWSDDTQTVLHRDIGFIARTKNPYNPYRSLTICNGIHSRGVLGAVRTLTDVRFRHENEAYLADRFPGGEFTILIKVPVVQGKAIGVALSDPDAVVYEWPLGRTAVAATEE